MTIPTPKYSSQDNDPLISIVTPAYKGAKHLTNLQANLEGIYQSNRNIEWIIVDDASPDDGQTRSCIERIVKSCPLPTRAIYLTTNHYGSKSTWSGASIAGGDYIIILDQDDSLALDAISTYTKLIKKFCQNENIAGACGRCTNSEKKIIGKMHHTEPTVTSDIRYRHLLRIHGELLQCTKKEIILKHFKDMKPGDTNGIIWSRIADNFDFVYTNMVTRHYNTTNPESVSNTNRIRFVETVAEGYLEHLERISSYLVHDPAAILRHAIHTRRFQILAKPFQKGVQPRKGTLTRILLAIVTPVAIILSYRDQAKGIVSNT